ncbi:MAG: nucleotidyltransferase family protein [Candidatus Omnitrophica bacterium]|nr:nucleotidyltransferase family protein [Candidatus Omnitrophota bacterium]
MDYGYLDMIHFSSIKETDIESRLALLLARWIIYDNGFEKIENLLMQEKIEWKKFREIIVYHELCAFAYICLKKHLYLLPNNSMELLKKDYYFCLTHQVFLWREFLRIAHIFRDKNIEFTPLKGIAFFIDNMYGERRYLRPMVDIDLMVKKETLPLVERILGSLGYEKHLGGNKEDYWKSQNYHLPFIKKRQKGLPCMAEMHWDLDYKRKNPLLPYLWSRIKKMRLDGKEISLLSPEDTLFSIALHHRRFGKMLCLKNVCDTAMLLERYKDDIDWHYILREAEREGMRTILYFIFTQATLLLDVKIPPFVLRRLDIPGYKRQLIERFILSNTFAVESGLNNYKSLYLRTHFLIYDNIWDPVKCVLGLPLEQFAKFYSLQPYSRRTNLLYKIRYLYFLKSLLVIILNATTKRMSKLLKNKK